MCVKSHYRKVILAVTSYEKINVWQNESFLMVSNGQLKSLTKVGKYMMWNQIRLAQLTCSFSRYLLTLRFRLRTHSFGVDLGGSTAGLLHLLLRTFGNSDRLSYGRSLG